MTTPLLQKLAAERERATIDPADIDAALLDRERTAAAKLSLLERRNAQEGIDAWVTAHPEAAHQATREALRMLRSSVELLPHEDLGADIQTAVERPRAYAEQTASNLTKMMENEVAFYKSDRPVSEKVLRAAVTVAAKLGALWLAAKIVGWGKKEGWMAKTIRYLGLAAGSAWLINYASRTMNAKTTTLPPSPPAALSGNLWKRGDRIAAGATSAEVTETAGKKTLTVAGKTFSVMKRMGVGVIGADIALLDMVSTLREDGADYVINDSYVVAKTELARVFALAQGQTDERQDIAIAYRTVAKKDVALSLGATLVKMPSAPTT